MNREELAQRAREIADQHNWGDIRTDALAKRYYDLGVHLLLDALTELDSTVYALENLLSADADMPTYQDDYDVAENRLTVAKAYLGDRS